MKAPALLLLALLAVLGIVVFGTGLWSPSAGTGGLPDPLPSAGVTMPALADEPVARRVAPPGAGFLDDSAPPNSRVEALNTQAKEALDGGRPAEAVLFLESAQALAPNDAVLTRNLAFAHYRVAETLMAAQDTEAAGAAFRRAWVLDDSRSAYGLHAASLRLRAFELSPALAQLDEVLARHPDSGNGQLMRGDVLNLLDRLEDSLAA